MNQLVNLNEMSPDQLNLLHDQIMKAKLDLFQKEVELVKGKLAQVEAENEILKHRIDNVDCTNVDGNARDRFNRMIRLYATRQGIYFNKAYREFIQRFNIAFRTNLELRMTNFCKTHGLKQITLPDYLERVGQIEDAIRVADKMLNRQSA